jgi:hypothetical protein
VWRAAVFPTTFPVFTSRAAYKESVPTLLDETNVNWLRNDWDNTLVFFRSPPYLPSKANLSYPKASIMQAVSCNLI